VKLDPSKIATSNTRAERPRRGTFRREGVRDTQELRRIAALPRRAPEHAAIEDCVRLSELLRRPGGTMTLHPVQATVFAELLERGGCVGSICAGGGKTLITLLAAEIVDAKRPVVLVPSGLVDKTRREYDTLGRHWNVSRVPTVIGYEMLGREQSSERLRELAPDLIAADEAHRLKNPKAAVTRRVRRYLDENESTIFVPFSGTLTNASLTECAHLFEWALGKLSPLPRRYQDVTEWGLAIDVDVPAGVLRFAPGALTQLYDEGEARLSANDELTATRSAVRRRMVETPGVVATHESFIGSSLRVNVIPLNVVRDDVDAAIVQLDETWSTPDGHPINDAASKWRHTLELGAGFYYVWDPRPPKAWLDARRAWSATCRHILGHNRRELDSELQVINAVHRGEYDGEVLTNSGMPIGNGLPVDETLRAWEVIKPTFEPNQEPRWLDDAVIDFVRAWIKEGPGLVWCGHVAVAERLEDVLGLPYYGRKGLSRAGVPIESARPADGSCVVSIASSGTGRNLQAWSRSLVIPSALGGAQVEQLLARTHREGQRADEVTYDFLITCGRAFDAYLKARSEAAFIQETTGQRQRLLFADVVDGCTPDVLGKNTARWGA
jgi:hypothetical protein